METKCMFAAFHRLRLHRMILTANYQSVFVATPLALQLLDAGGHAFLPLLGPQRLFRQAQLLNARLLGLQVHQPPPSVETQAWERKREGKREVRTPSRSRKD